MKIYISGKISGCLIATSRRKFAKAEKHLRRIGYEVVNPMKLPHFDVWNYAACMALDLKELRGCDAIYLLDDYRDSEGALIEYETARLNGQSIFKQGVSEPPAIKPPVLAAVIAACALVGSLIFYLSLIFYACK